MLLKVNIFCLTSVILIVCRTVQLQVVTPCQGGTFGSRCQVDCHCETPCNQLTGQCTTRCLQEDIVRWDGPTCQLENKALDSDTTQSSTRSGVGHLYSSGYAVDGKVEVNILDLTCSITDEQKDPWWRVNLGKQYDIKKIVVLNTDSLDYQVYLGGFEVYISNSTLPEARETLCFHHPNKNKADLETSFRCNGTLRGQFVTIRQPNYNRLVLCEVKVYACVDGSYGENCEKVCGYCLNGESCDPVTGACPTGLCDLGYTGINCNQPCSQGMFGRDCRSQCGGCRAGSTCDPIIGTCEEGCADGWKTQFCNISCEGQCVERCGQCLDNEPCDTKYRTGVCPRGCAAGWMGNLCDKACQDGFYGIACSLTCARCQVGSVCDRVTGECPNGCQRGWIGSNCDIRNGPVDPQAGVGNDSTDGGNKTGVIVGCVIAAIVILAVGLLGLLYYKRKSGKSRDDILPIPRLNGNTIHGRENPGLSPEPSERTPDGNHNNTSPSKVPPPKTVSGVLNPAQISASSLITINPIPVGELKDFIQSKDESQFGFEPEFGMLPVGLMTHADMGTLPFNRPKNRFQAIIPYDYNRIVLDTPDRDPFYQYINASYIDGYKKGKAYIMAQAPLKATSFDFWRMIWQENVGKIVMITNLVEAGKVKSEQYWSDFDKRTFGHFVVEVESSIELADFTLRTFLVSSTVTSEQRTIKHFHFTAWPDQGVPRHALSVLFFRKKVVSAASTCPGPMIVHCSAGIGRSGTYIALDMLIQQASREKMVDVYNTVVRLRQQRANIIPSVEQYAFLYEALLEAIWFEDTSISFVDFHSTFHKLCKMDPLTGNNKLQDQFELLDSVKPMLTDDEIRAALLPENSVKNRHPDIIAGDHHRPLLSTHHKGSTDYINAVKIPSYRQKTVFFVTEVPLPLIVMDFWRLVYDHTCSTIVLLGDIDIKDKACGVYWPEEIGVVHMERFTVELASTTKLEHNITERLLKLNVLQGIKKERMVKQFHFPDWALDSDVPESQEALLYLLKTLEAWQLECGTQPVIIQCLDGCRCSGMFCAIYLLLERLQVDKEADVFSTVRLIRDARPQFITSFDQFKFCYEALDTHISEMSEDTDAL